MGEFPTKLGFLKIEKAKFPNLMRKPQVNGIEVKRWKH